MYALDEARQQIITELKKAIGKEFSPTVSELTVPPNAAMGDLAYPCFVLAKGLKRNPAEIASELAAKIGPKGYIKKITSAGPYVNFTLDDATFGTSVLQQIRDQKDAYGTSTSGAKKRVMVEYANLNTHKDVHVGHLRNMLVGQIAVSTLNANGYDVIPATYINDLGAHVAACVWAVKNLSADGGKSESDKIMFMQRMYVEATAKAESDPKVKEEISQVQRDLEAGKGPYLSLWKKTHKWSIDSLKAVFKELKLPLDVWYLEHQIIDDTKRIIEDLIKKAIVTHSNGAWIVDLESEKLGVNLLVKSDGTLLYNAKDLALALRKEEEHHPQRSIYVIDSRQSLVMKQLFATLKRMGFPRELTHLSYEFLTLKEGAMSSRKGNIIRYEDFRESMIEAAREETKKRHPDWKEKKIEATARAIAFAAMRFGILKQDLDKKIVFDMQEALSFDGFTGPYLLYTRARTKSILKKAKRMKPVYEATHASDPAEHTLLTLLAKYPDVVFDAGDSLRLSLLPQYLFDVCQAFSAYYDKVPVLQAEKGIAAERLATVDSVRQVLDNGFALLGIEPLDEM